MSIKLILCPLHGEAHQLNVLVSACQIAPALGAKVRILHVAAPAPVYPYAVGMSQLAKAEAGLDLSIDHLDAAERELIEQGKRYARRYAAQAALAFGVDGEAEALPPDTGVVFRVAVGTLADRLPVESRTCDLVLMGFDNRPDGDRADIVAALSHGRRPVLLVPRTPGATVAPTGRPKTVVVAWDASAPCAQAVHDAMPFLVMATEVFVVRVGEAHAVDRPADDDLKTYLASHGVAAEIIDVPRDRGSVGERLLAQASALGADLLVMGAYGHGHLSEMVFGGATDHVLKQSHIPLLMAR